MTRFPKLVAALAAAVASVPVFAQEGSVTIDTSAADTAVNAIGTAISGLLKGSVMTNILVVIGAGVTIGVLFVAIRYIIRGGKTAAK